MNTEEHGLKTGKYTMFHIDSGLALTHRSEIEITEFRGEKIVFKPRGKRKLYMRELERDMLFLRGWDLGLKVDTDYSSFAGNALLNFVGEPEAIKAKIAELNDYKHSRLGVITYVSEADYADMDAKKMLYPEQAAETGHAVVERILSD